jgi:hypothetical protein
LSSSEFLDEADYEQIRLAAKRPSASALPLACTASCMRGVKRDVVDEDFYLKHAICVSADEDFT